MNNFWLDRKPKTIKVNIWAAPHVAFKMRDQEKHMPKEGILLTTVEVPAPAKTAKFNVLNAVADTLDQLAFSISLQDYFDGHFEEFSGEDWLRISKAVERVIGEKRISKVGNANSEQIVS